MDDRYYGNDEDLAVVGCMFIVVAVAVLLFFLGRWMASEEKPDKNCTVNSRETICIRKSVL